jgi:tetratricopeptide (TPR) repeat protein
MISLDRLTECVELLRELRRRYPLPRVQMTSAYALAMVYTRFLVPADHDTALELANAARAIAALEPDPVEAVFFQVYQDNGLALIETHRGNLQRAFDLVDAGLRRLDREVPTSRYVVHRSQLLHNRARALIALGRLDEAYADLTVLIGWDPYYVEYHTDRGNVSRRRGDLAAALAVLGEDPDVLGNRGIAYTDLGRYGEALADFDRALAVPGADHTELRRQRDRCVAAADRAALTATPS